MLSLDPIAVSRTPTKAQLAAGIRQGVLVVGSVATTLGYSQILGPLDQVAQLAGPISIGLSFLLGQLATRKTAKQKIRLANAAPDSVGFVE